MMMLSQKWCLKWVKRNRSYHNTKPLERNCSYHNTISLERKCLILNSKKIVDLTVENQSSLSCFSKNCTFREIIDRRMFTVWNFKILDLSSYSETLHVMVMFVSWSVQVNSFCGRLVIVGRNVKRTIISAFRACVSQSESSINLLEMNSSHHYI